MKNKNKKQLKINQKQKLQLTTHGNILLDCKVKLYIYSNIIIKQTNK